MVLSEEQLQGSVGLCAKVLSQVPQVAHTVQHQVPHKAWDHYVGTQGAPD